MRSESENPWARLPWTLGLALFAWVVLLWAFGEFLSRPEAVRPEQKPIDAKLIEIPAPPKPSRPKGVPQPSRALPKPAAHPKAVTPLKPAVKPAPARPAPPAKPEPVRPASPEPAASGKGLPGGNEMGARAIYNPEPEIPEEYRQDEMDVLVVARFHIALDGTSKVELVTATAIPGLNQSILDTLQTWKFFPALQDGKPVASVQDVRFRFQVK